jgi:hypothetical protein
MTQNKSTVPRNFYAFFKNSMPHVDPKIYCGHRASWAFAAVDFQGKLVPGNRERLVYFDSIAADCDAEINNELPAPKSPTRYAWFLGRPPTGARGNV